MMLAATASRLVAPLFDFRGRPPGRRLAWVVVKRSSCVWTGIVSRSERAATTSRTRAACGPSAPGEGKRQADEERLRGLLGGDRFDLGYGVALALDRGDGHGETGAVVAGGDADPLLPEVDAYHAHRKKQRTADRGWGTGWALPGWRIIRPASRGRRLRRRRGLRRSWPRLCRRPGPCPSGRRRHHRQPSRPV